MEVAKIFETGRSQAVRLPKKFRFADNEVLIQRLGDAVMLVPKDAAWKGCMDLRMTLWRRDGSRRSPLGGMYCDVYAGYQHLHLCHEEPPAPG